jgi:beta-glucanase (GH16 family)
MNIRPAIHSLRREIPRICSRTFARIQISAGQGMWSAFWRPGDSIESVGWPKCGEFDIMENIGKEPATVHGSIHGQALTGTSMGLPTVAPGSVPFSRRIHAFGLIWSPGKVMYYVDSPSHVYATFTLLSLRTGAVWPFDSGKFFFILNLAAGGNWPRAPNASTHFPAENAHGLRAGLAEIDGQFADLSVKNGKESFCPVIHRQISIDSRFTRV